MSEQLLTRLASSAAVGAADVAVLAAGHAPDSEIARRLHPEVVDAIRAAGFARHFVPARWGGAAGSFAECLRAVSIVGEGDASAAWCASIFSTLARMCAFLPVEGQQELWDDGPDALVVGALMPGGSAERVDGGWRVSGEWPFISGIDFSDWALVCAAAHEGERSVVRFFALPRRNCQVKETWFNVGMRASGSNTIVVDDVFVPSALSFARDDLLAGRAPGGASVPLKAVNGLSFAAPVLGAVKGALLAWSAIAAQRVAAAADTSRTSGSNASSIPLVLARSAAEIDAAELLLERVANVADGALDDAADVRSADGAADVGEMEAARGLRDCCVSVDLLVGCANRLFRSAGTRAQAETSAFQRFWRDANTAAGHVVLQLEPAATSYASLVFEQPGRTR